MQQRATKWTEQFGRADYIFLHSNFLSNYLCCSREVWKVFAIRTPTLCRTQLHYFCIISKAKVSQFLYFSAKNSFWSKATCEILFSTFTGSLAILFGGFLQIFIVPHDMRNWKIFAMNNLVPDCFLYKQPVFTTR